MSSSGVSGSSTQQDAKGAAGSVVGAPGAEAAAAGSPWREVCPQQQPKERPRDLHTLYTRRQLEAVLHRERARADRNNSEFSLVLFRVRADETRLTLRLARLMLRRSRTIDELGWFDETCIAALLPYTNAEGARAFSENVLQQAQEQLIPAMCRIYTYPSAWYFESDKQNSNGNGHSRNGNGHSNGNGTHHSSNGNGHANGNGHHANGNGNASGNGKHATDVTIERRGAGTHARGEEKLEPSDLLPYFLQGVHDGLQPPDAGTDGVEKLLVRHLPWWKRAIDIIGAATGLIALSPVMCISAAAIKMSSPGPVVFKQRRAGIGGQPFWIYKFRTMTSDAEQKKAALRKFSEQDGPAFKLKDDPRITPVGKFLRETSLDELPQLWNVLKGDMSLVGPRPLPMDESAECAQWQRRRLDVTPGLTCIWQVKGRSRVTFDEWMRMDVNYIRRRSIFHDMKIMFETLPAVILRRGAR
jgi:lipopolysaccharide/colanic/teichoic acid biosynthesis glycosyltransferase